MGTNTSSSSSSPPAAFTQAYTDLVNQATGVAQQPLQQYTGNIVAGLSPDQQAAISTVQNSQGIADPYINAAAQDFGNANGQQIAQQYGQQAIDTSQNVANAVWPAVNNSAQQATGIAQGGAQAAGQQATTGAGIALQGAQSNANLANQYASTNVASQLPSYNGAQGVAQYESPYTQQVVNSTQAEFNNQNAQQNQSLIGNAISSGAWGGDRAGVAQGIAAGQEQLAQGQTIAGLENSGYTNAQSEYNTQEQLQASLGQSQAQLGASTALSAGSLLNSSGLGAGQLTSGTTLSGASLGANTNLGAGSLVGNTGIAMGNMGINAANVAGQLGLAGSNQELEAGFGEGQLGSEAENTTLEGANAQMAAGTTEQNQEQEQLNVPYEQFLQQQAYPFQSTNWLSSIVEGLGSAAGGTSTTSQTPNLLSEIGGAGLSIASLFAKRGGAIKQKARGGGIAAYDSGGSVPGAPASSSINAGVPDVSISFVPNSGNNTPHGAGPPKPPSMAKQQDPMQQGIAAAGSIEKIKGKMGGSFDDSGIDQTFNQNLGASTATQEASMGDNSDIESALAQDIPEMDAMRRGGGIAALASGGHTGGSGGGISSNGPMFSKSLTSATGVSIPQLSTKHAAAPGIAANLTQDYGNTPTDSKGVSTLPSSTYWPTVGPWSTNKANPNAISTDTNPLTQADLDGDFSTAGMRRGGRTAFDDGGDVDSSDGDADGDMDDGSGGPPAPPDATGIAAGAAPFATHTIDAEPDATKVSTSSGIAAGAPPPPSSSSKGIVEGDHDTDALPTKSGYEPHYAADTSDADHKRARSMGLLTAGLAMMGGSSGNAFQNIGRGALAGVSTYDNLTSQAETRAAAVQKQNTDEDYRKMTADDAAKKLSLEAQWHKDAAANLEKHQTGQDALNEKKETDLQAYRDKTLKAQNRPNWVPSGVDGEGNLVYVDSHSQGSKPTTYTATGVKPKPAAQKAGMLSDAAVDDLATRGIAGEPITTFIGNNPADKAAVLNRISEKAAQGNIDPKAITAAVVQLQADKAGARTLAQMQGRVESSVVEADKFADNALAASAKVNRTNFTPVNTAINAWKSNTGDPDIIAFGFANNSLANAYATAVGKGTKTVQDTEEALHLLNTARSNEQYAAAIRTLKMETHAAQAAPDVVRNRMAARIAGNNPFANSTNIDAIGGSRDDSGGGAGGGSVMPPGATKSATDANGKKIYLINGKWSPG